MKETDTHRQMKLGTDQRACEVIHEVRNTTKLIHGTVLPYEKKHMMTDAQ